LREKFDLKLKNIALVERYLTHKHFWKESDRKAEKQNEETTQ
jgi:hypothetical protein